MPGLQLQYLIANVSIIRSICWDSPGNTKLLKNILKAFTRSSSLNWCSWTKHFNTSLLNSLLYNKIMWSHDPILYLTYPDPKYSPMATLFSISVPSYRNTAMSSGVWFNKFCSIKYLMPCKYHNVLHFFIIVNISSHIWWMLAEPHSAAPPSLLSRNLPAQSQKV